MLNFNGLFINLYAPQHLRHVRILVLNTPLRITSRHARINGVNRFPIITYRYARIIVFIGIPLSYSLFGLDDMVIRGFHYYCMMC